jgi:hypothetical protein
MKYRLKKISSLSGNKGSIYSVILDDEDITLYEKFLAENTTSFLNEIRDINKRLEIIGKQTGAREHYFKLKEGNLGDGVAALYDLPSKNLRLYCIRYGTQLIILGGGGNKKVQKLQQDAKLKLENFLLRDISKLITEKLNDDLFFTNDGLDFKGDLEFEDNSND